MHLLVQCPAFLYCVNHRFTVDVHRDSAGSQEIRTCLHQETHYLVQCEGFFYIDVGLTHSAGKSAAARNTSPEPGVPCITPAQLGEDASEAPVVESGWCAESYHDAPFIRNRTCNQSFISEHSPLLGATGILGEEYLALWY